MAPTVKYLIVLGSVGTFYVVGLLLFGRGFLLKRASTSENSTCLWKPDHIPPRSLGNVPLFAGDNKTGCWIPRRFSKAVLIVVDGLRYDFIQCRPKANNSKANRAYENKFDLPCQLARRRPRNSLLAHFVADPPTTTMQRIQGLTTGSLPTFVDIGGNFATFEIKEDNLIAQMRRHDRPLVFMGDDTWVSLFPDHFHRAYPFPSFDVRDLNSVDEGVMEHLIPTLRSKDWNVLVAHFLGVDHCGHTHGADHPAMATKLLQMNSMLQSVIDNLDDDTVLFLFGDHGMTENGDHGGDSSAEVDSALFVYSRQTLHSSNQISNGTYRQIDLTPTLALLLGIPIPSGNLGMVMDDVFVMPGTSSARGETSLQDDFRSAALFVNVLQVQKYLESYQHSNNDFPQNLWKELQLLFDDVQASIKNSTASEFNFEDKRKWDLAKKACKLYLEKALLMCQGEWAKFDLSLMILGISEIVGITIVGFLLHHSAAPSTRSSCCFAVAGVTNVALLVSLLCSSLREGHLFLFFLPWIILLGVQRCPSSISGKWSVESGIAAIAMLLYGVSLFSNSFVINEAVMLNFLFQSLLVLAALRAFSIPVDSRQQSSKGNKSKDVVYEKNALTMLGCLILLCVTMRLSLNFQRCREEQFWCVESNFLQPLTFAQNSESSFRHWRYFISIASVGLIPFVLIRWLGRTGNINGFSPTVFSAKYGLVLTAAFICYFWALQTLPKALLQRLQPWQLLWAPRAVFLLAGTIAAFFLISPLTLYILPQKKSLGNIYTGNSEEFVRSLYQNLKTNWRTHLSPSSASNIPVVYGLATTYSAAMLVVLTTLVLLIMLLWGDGLALPTLLLVSSILLVTTIVALKKNLALNQVDRHAICPTDLVLWLFLASQYFYTTGHQTTIPSIQWQAAFVGADDEMTSYLGPAFKILLSTFGSQVILSMALPLLLIWPHTLPACFPTLVSQEALKESQGELTILHQEDESIKALFRGSVDYMILCGIKLLAIMCSAFLHRRHLMVWKIFAPRLMFEAAAFVLGYAGLLLGFLAMIHIHSRLCKWINDLGNLCSKTS